MNVTRHPKYKRLLLCSVILNSGSMTLFVHAFQPDFPPIHQLTARAIAHFSVAETLITQGRSATRILQCHSVIEFMHFACLLLNHASNAVTNFSHCSTATCHFVANGHASIASPPIQRRN